MSHTSMRVAVASAFARALMFACVGLAAFGTASAQPAGPLAHIAKPGQAGKASGHLPAEPWPRGGRLNDTGQTRCIDPTVIIGDILTIDCPGSGQDGEFGRDVSAKGTKDGRLGFGFVKISNTGAELPADASNWACVRDKVTGLIWEVKTDDGGLRDMHNTYTNYGDGRIGDSSEFVAAVNAVGLCGASDWRLPSRLMLHSLVDYGIDGYGLTIDVAWFPNTRGSLYWTDSVVVHSDSRWYVDFSDGEVRPQIQHQTFAVRLVRSR